MIVAIIINYNIDTDYDDCGKTADEEEDDGGDYDQPAVNPKSHLKIMEILMKMRMTN